MDRLRPWADRVLGSRPLTAASRHASRKTLRILAYHGVSRPDVFAAHMAHLDRYYRPVDATTVVEALRGEIELPESAVWVTFDDGHPDVVDNAAPIMRERGISATMFVCPGLIDTSRPFWWEVVSSALESGVTWELDRTSYDRSSSDALIARLKTIPDSRRREVVADLEEVLVSRPGASPSRQQVTSRQLAAFVDSGGHLGNHTWDHPCLDTCTDPEVRRQIEMADDWLVGFGMKPRLFAYPNGNHSREAEAALDELGYEAAFLFDHRLTTGDENCLALSRLRVNDDTTLDRFAAIVSGVHPMIHRLRSSINTGIA